jgi:hypothetical protein
VGRSIIVDGSDPDFAQATLNDLATIGTTQRGQERLRSLEESGRRVSITSRSNPHDPDNAETHPDNVADALPAGQTVVDEDGNLVRGTGRGSDSAVEYDPSHWPNQAHPQSPSDAMLFHELTHADHNAHGEDDQTLSDASTTTEEARTVDEENQYRFERGLEQRQSHADLP